MSNSPLVSILSMLFEKIKIDEDDVIMMDADFEFGVDDSHGTGYSASVGDASNILKLSSLDGKTADRNFYTVLDKMDRDERQNAARFRRNQAYVPLFKYIERLYKTIRHVYFSNSSIRSSANIQTSKRMLSLIWLSDWVDQHDYAAPMKALQQRVNRVWKKFFSPQGDRSEDGR